MRAATVHRKPAGGYRLIRAGQLTRAWECYRSKSITLGDLRVYLACHEMKARRCGRGRGNFNLIEVFRLSGLKRPRPAIRRLEEAGLLTFNEEGLEFPVDDTRRVPVPRRMLRHLAEHGRPSLIATVFGLLLRCLFWEKGRGVINGGRCKASKDIADVFGVDLRRVKAARAELVELGWLEPLPEKQWAWNRWGGAYRVNMEWGVLPPPAAAECAPLPPPDSDEKPLAGFKDQEPQDPGVSIRDVRPEDLKDTARTLELHAQAVEAGLVGPSEHERLQVLAAAEHARAVGKTNPCGLFAMLVRGKHWNYLTQSDEDRASARLKAHLFPRPETVEVPRPVQVPTNRLSDDEALVRAVLAAATRAGYKGDPFYILRQQGWTRDRWDAAGPKARDARTCYASRIGNPPPASGPPVAGHPPHC